jgi:hypothetical protein
MTQLNELKLSQQPNSQRFIMRFSTTVYADLSTQFWGKQDVLLQKEAANFLQNKPVTIPQSATSTLLGRRKCRLKHMAITNLNLELRVLSAV